MSVLRAVAVGALVLVAVPVGCTYLGVFNNAATAPARVVNKTLETNNIIFNYERFFDVKANYDSRVSQIQEHKSLLADTTDAAEKTNLRIELSAMKQSCRELANGYNADSRKLNRGLFKDRNLPYELDVNSCE
jgi:hypothetical protein